jgi:hypothetical protein
MDPIGQPTGIIGLLGNTYYRVYQNSTAKLQEWIPHTERRKKCMTACVWKCIVTELPERVFTECTLTRPHCRNKIRVIRPFSNVSSIPAIRTCRRALSKCTLGQLCNYTFPVPMLSYPFFSSLYMRNPFLKFAVEFWYTLYNDQCVITCWNVLSNNKR